MVVTGDGWKKSTRTSYSGNGRCRLVICMSNDSWSVATVEWRGSQGRLQGRVSGRWIVVDCGCNCDCDSDREGGIM